MREPPDATSASASTKGQGLPATSLLHGLDVVVGTRGAGSPGAAAAVCSIEGNAIALILSQLL